MRIRCIIFDDAGLKLNKVEYDAFLKRYMSVNNFSKRDVVQIFAETSSFDYADDEVDALYVEALDECGYKKSILAGQNASFTKSDYFRIDAFTPADSEAMSFAPYFRNDKSNLPCYNANNREEYVDRDYFCEDLSSESVYIAFSDRCFNDTYAFERKPYASYEEFVQEFKDKFEKYLPEDFDWDAHLGNFKCVFHKS